MAHYFDAARRQQIETLRQHFSARDGIRPDTCACAEPILVQKVPDTGRLVALRKTLLWLC